MTDENLVIDLHDVRKIYRRRVHALRGIDIQVHRGEIFGLLGANGAGKSTLIKIMTTVIRPTAASGTILSRPVGNKPTLARMGYLPEHATFAPYLTGRQVIDYYGTLLKVPRTTRRKRTAELIDTVGMTTWADKKISRYSKGMVQRIALAQALINDPELVLLDEPTDGVDPLGRRHIRVLLAALKDQGKTVFLNSHLLSETQRLCDRVAMLAAGKVVSQGTLDELTRHAQGYTLTADAGETALRAAIAPAPPPPGLTVTNGSIHTTTTDTAMLQPLIDALRAAGICIVSVQRSTLSLEDLFVQIVGEDGRGVGAIQAGRREMQRIEAAETASGDRP